MTLEDIDAETCLAELECDSLQGIKFLKTNCQLQKVIAYNSSEKQNESLYKKLKSTGIDIKHCNYDLQ